MAITRLVRSRLVDGVYVTVDPPEVETTWVGRVLRVFNRDYRAMSDVYTLATYAEVWTDDNKVMEIMVNANFECDHSGGRAEVDATSEILSIKLLFDIQREKEEKARRERDRLEREEKAREAERNRPVKGKEMVVFKGRKVPIGTTGVVAFVADDRVLLKDKAHWQDRKADGVWVNPSNLKAV